MQFLQRIAKEDCFRKPDSSRGLRLAIWDTSDDFPPRSAPVGFDVKDASSIPYWIIADGLKYIDDISSKRRLILDTMFASTGLYAFVWVADGCDKRHEKVHFWPQLTEEETARIKIEAIKRFKKAAKSGKLIRSPHLEALLWGWRRFDTKSPQQQVLRWLSKASNPDILRLLRAFVSRGSSWGMDSYYVKPHASIIWDNLEEFAPFEKWQAAVKRVIGRKSVKKLPEEVILFRQAEKRKASGKSDKNRHLGDQEDMNDF
jgi:hypothetical protein